MTSIEKIMENIRNLKSAMNFSNSETQIIEIPSNKNRKIKRFLKMRLKKGFNK